METIQGQPNICHHKMECMVTMDFTVPKLAILSLDRELGRFTHE